MVSKIQSALINGDIIFKHFVSAPSRFKRKKVNFVQKVWTECQLSRHQYSSKRNHNKIWRNSTTYTQNIKNLQINNAVYAKTVPWNIHIFYSLNEYLEIRIEFTIFDHILLHKIHEWCTNCVEPVIWIE